LRRPPISPLFPYTTLFRSQLFVGCYVFGILRAVRILGTQLVHTLVYFVNLKLQSSFLGFTPAGFEIGSVALPVLKRGKSADGDLDRKSTRLNSSHVKISYA